MSHDSSEMLKRRQQAAQLAYNKMIATLIEFSPCGKLTIDDALFIARTAQTLAFDATEQVQS